MAETFGAFDYPVTKEGECKETLHGVVVEDPFRWLEEPDADETKAWVKDQNKVTNAFLAKCKGRDDIRKKLGEVNDYDKMGTPFRRGPRYMYFKRSGLQNQSVLYKMPVPEEGEELDLGKSEALLDLNKVDEKGTTALRVYSFSDDGELLAYGISESGSDWVTVKVKQVGTCDDHADILKWVKFSDITWLKDGSGFFYCRYKSPEGMAALKEDLKGDDDKHAGTEVDANKNQMMYFHKLGTSQDDDLLVWQDADHPNWMFDATITHDGKTLIIGVTDGCEPVNHVYYVDVEESLTPWLAGAGDLNVVKVIDNFDAEYSYIANNDRTFYFKTNNKAPRYKVIKIEFPAPGANPPAAELEAIPQTDVHPQIADVLEWCVCVGGDKLLLCYMRDVVNVVEVRALDDPDAKPIELTLPSLGTIVSFSGKRHLNEVFVQFASILYPGSILTAQLPEAGTPIVPNAEGGLTTKTWWEAKVPGFVADDFVTEQVFAVSKDGTKVPYFITQSKARKASGEPAPTILYGYGGFNVSLTPTFSPSRIVWLRDLGGAYAYSNLRGGGEYGEEWHKAGQLKNKQNVYDDLVACGESLISDGVTTSGKLAIMGGSNGGLLVLATMLQRPSLFKCVIAQVPVTDMLRFHKFTIGHAWCTEYGNAEENKEDFDTVMAYSPLHNVKPIEDAKSELPATLILSADHDDRVVPLHTLKMLATLQMVAGKSELQKNPLVARIEEQAGHGAGKPMSKVLDEYADTFAFVSYVTGGAGGSVDGASGGGGGGGGGGGADADA